MIRAAARRERRAHRPRDGAVRRRPRRPARARARGRAAGATRAPEHRRRRRPCVGARRGTAAAPRRSRYSRRALRLGTHDALKYFHRGMIERCLGHAPPPRWFRRALALNPHFSLLWEPLAAEVSRREAARACCSGCVAALAAPAAARRTRSGTSRSTASAGSSLRRPRLRQLRPRPGRDPGLPGAAKSRRAASGLRARGSPRGSTRELDGRSGRAHSARRTRSPSRPGRPACTRFASRRLRGRRERGAEVALRRQNFAGRIGWHEVVVRPRRRRADASSAPSTSVSDELRAYPKDLLESPLDVTTRRCVARATRGAARRSTGSRARRCRRARRRGLREADRPGTTSASA